MGLGGCFLPSSLLLSCAFLLGRRRRGGGDGGRGFLWPRKNMACALRWATTLGLGLGGVGKEFSGWFFSGWLSTEGDQWLDRLEQCMPIKCVECVSDGLDGENTVDVSLVHAQCVRMGRWRGGRCREGGSAGLAIVLAAFRQVVPYEEPHVCPMERMPSGDGELLTGSGHLDSHARCSSPYPLSNARASFRAKAFHMIANDSSSATSICMEWGEWDDLWFSSSIMTPG